MIPESPDRRRMLWMLAALAGGGRAFGQTSEGSALRLELERTYISWLQAMRRGDVAAFATQTSRYRQMCLRNEVVSMRQPWPSAVFKSVIQAPDISTLRFVDAAVFGDTARAVYFGRVDFVLDSPVTPENPLIVRFLRENGVWKFDWIQYVNFGADDTVRREAKACEPSTTPVFHWQQHFIRQLLVRQLLVCAIVPCPDSKAGERKRCCNWGHWRPLARRIAARPGCRTAVPPACCLLLFECDPAKLLRRQAGRTAKRQAGGRV